MKKVKSTFLLGLTSLFLSSWFSPLPAVDLYDEFTVQIGYRQDNYKATSQLTPSIKSKFQMKHLDLVVAGIKCNWFWPEWDYCGRTFLNNFFFSGFANWGWETGADKFNENLTQAIFSKGKIRSARTEDYQIGLGYFFQLGDFFYRYSGIEWDRWGLSCSAGYAWDHQKVITENGRTSGAISLNPNPRYNGLRFNQYWEGPWVGTELVRDWETFTLNIGYEYHFSLRMRSSIDAPFFLIPDLEISDIRKAKDGTGNVGYATGTFHLCSVLDFGLAFKYQEWKSGEGKLSYKFNEPDFVQTDISTSNTWRTYSIMANIDYFF